MGAYKAGYDGIDWGASIDFVKEKVEYIPAMRSDFPMPMISGDYQAYECPVTGKTIEGRRAHEENLKSTGCRVLEPGEKEDNVKTTARMVAEEDKRRDAAIDGIVDSVANEYFS